MIIFTVAYLKCPTGGLNNDSKKLKSSQNLRSNKPPNDKNERYNTRIKIDGNSSIYFLPGYVNGGRLVLPIDGKILRKSCRSSFRNHYFLPSELLQL